MTSSRLDFRSSASSYSIGFHFDGPLNREAERNTYRASQITNEQARRSYMALEDQIVRTIRSDLRDLNTEKVSFDIARESLISAARQYLAARADLLTAGAGADPTSTQNILLALNAVLTANNTLIGSWVSYEQTRIQLLLDMEVLQVDERGLYRDGNDNPADNVPGNALGGNDPADNVPANTTAAGPEAAPGP